MPPLPARSVLALLCAASLAAVLAPLAAAPTKPAARRPLLIAHRGASGYRPEHTLAAYELAIEQGADYIEPDLVVTRDGVLVARHENEIGGTTDVSTRPEFASRKTTKSIDGREVAGWFTEDFTLAELKTLRCKERIPDLRPENARHDGKYPIPTFQEVIDLAKRRSKATKRTIGIYPETKHPGYFRAAGLPLEDRLVEALNKNGYTTPAAPVFVQSFEVANLKELRRKTRVRLVQLLSSAGSPADGAKTYKEMATAAGLREIATYADGVGPEKSLVIPRAGDGSLGKPTTFVADAHAAGLLVHPWTFRAENAFLPADQRRGDSPIARGDLAAEIRRFREAGVDGLFSDHPADAAAALR